MTIFVKTYIFTEIIPVTSVEDGLFVFVLSTSKMTSFWVISVEDELFVGLSASKVSCFWVISIEDDLDLGYQRRR